MEECVGCPRHSEIVQADGYTILAADRAVLERAFRSRSKSVHFMEKRLLEASRCLDRLVGMGYQLWQVSDWQMATFIHKFSQNKGKATRLRSALRWLEWITGVSMYADNRLVRDQVQDDRKGERKRPRHAKPPGEDIISNLEKLVVYAPTPQLRCAAGLLALLAHTSHRGLDGIRSRSMQVTEAAFAGESLVKTSDTWTSWVIPLGGFSGTAWPTLWMQELLDAGLPGPDYVLNGFDGYCKKLSRRCATTSDLEIAYRMLLQTPPQQLLTRRCSGDVSTWP